MARTFTSASFTVEDLHRRGPPSETVSLLVEQVWNGRRLDLLPELFADPFQHSGRADSPDSLRAWHEAEAATW